MSRSCRVEFDGLLLRQLWENNCRPVEMTLSTVLLTKRTVNQPSAWWLYSNLVIDGTLASGSCGYVPPLLSDRQSPSVPRAAEYGRNQDQQLHGDQAHRFIMH